MENSKLHKLCSLSSAVTAAVIVQRCMKRRRMVLCKVPDPLNTATSTTLHGDSHKAEIPDVAELWYVVTV